MQDLAAYEVMVESPWSLKIWYQQVCDDFKEDLVKNLPLSSFSYTGSPANCDDPSYIKFNDEENHWTPCDGSHLVLQLSGTPHVTMIAFKGRQSGFVKKFEVFHSLDGSQYHKIKFSSKNYFEKFSSQLEYLSFPHPIRMKWIKINVLEVIGDSPSMKLDLIECQATRNFFDDHSKKNYPNLMKYRRSISMDVGGGNYQGFLYSDKKAVFHKNGEVVSHTLHPVLDINTIDTRSPKMYYLKDGVGGEVWKLWHDDSRLTSNTNLFLVTVTTLYKFDENYRAIAWPQYNEYDDFFDRGVYISNNPDNLVFSSAATIDGLDYIYLLHDSGILYTLRLLEYDNAEPQDYIPFEPSTTCQAIDVSPDGILWCLDFNGDIYEFDRLDGKWHHQFNVKKYGSIIVRNLAVTMTTLEWLDADANLHTLHRVNGVLEDDQQEHGNFIPILSSGLVYTGFNTIGAGTAIFWEPVNRRVFAVHRAKNIFYKCEIRQFIDDNYRHYSHIFGVSFNIRNGGLDCYYNEGQAVVGSRKAVAEKDNRPYLYLKSVVVRGHYYQTSEMSSYFSISHLSVWRKFMFRNSWLWRWRMGETLDLDGFSTTKPSDADGITRSTCSSIGLPFYDPLCSTLDTNTEGKTYYLGYVKVTFTQASVMCQRDGGHLAVITSQSEEEAASRHCKINIESDAIMLGLHVDNGWVNGETSQYRNFGNSQPHNARKCVAMSVTNGNWMYYNCATKRRFLCEAPATLSQKILLPVSTIMFDLNGECSATDEKSNIALYNEANPQGKQFIVIHMEDIFFEEQVIIRSVQIRYKVQTFLTGDVSQTLYIAPIARDLVKTCEQAEMLSDLEAAVQPWPIMEWTIDPSTEEIFSSSPNISAYITAMYGSQHRNKTSISLIIFWKDKKATGHHVVDNLMLSVIYRHFPGRNFLAIDEPTKVGKTYRYWRYSTPKMITINSRFKLNLFSSHSLVVAFGIDHGIIPYRTEYYSNPHWKTWEEYEHRRISPLSVEIHVFQSINADHPIIGVSDVTTKSHLTAPLPQNNFYKYYLGSQRLVANAFSNIKVPNPNILFLFGKHAKNLGIGANLARIGSQSKISERGPYGIPYFAHNHLKLEFNYLKAASISALTDQGAFTLAFSVRISATTRMIFLTFGELKTCDRILFDDRHLVFSKSNSEGEESDILRSATRLEENVWYHICIVHLNGKLDIYLDSKLDATRYQVQFNLLGQNDPSKIYFFSSPGLNNGLLDMFEGAVSCFQMYNVPLPHYKVKSIAFCPVIFADHGIYCNGIPVPPSSYCECYTGKNARFVSKTDCTNYYFWNLGGSSLQLDFDDESIETMVEKRHGNKPHDPAEILITENMFRKASPFNKAICSSSTSYKFLTFPNNWYVSNLGGSLVLTFWMRIQELLNQPAGSEHVIYKHGSIYIIGTVEEGVKQRIKARILIKSNDEQCPFDLYLPINSWFYLLIHYHPSTSYKYHIHFNGLSLHDFDDTCTVINIQTFTETTEARIGDSGVDVCLDQFNNHNHFWSLSLTRQFFYNWRFGYRRPWEGILINSTEITPSAMNNQKCYKEIFNKNTSECFNVDDETLEYEIIQDNDWVSYPSAEPINEDLLRATGPSWDFLVTSDMNWVDEYADKKTWYFKVFRELLVDMFKDIIGKCQTTLHVHDFHESGDSKAVANITIFLGCNAGPELADAIYNNLTYAYRLRNFNIEAKPNPVGLPPFNPPDFEMVVYNETSFKITVNDQACIDEQYHYGFYISGTINYYQSLIVEKEFEETIHTGVTEFFIHGLKMGRSYRVKFYCLTVQGSSPGKEKTIDVQPGGIKKVT